MRDMEDALRRAMADDVAGVTLPAGFAGQVQARHRRLRRIRLSATLASVVAIVVAVPLATSAVLRDTATPPPADAPAEREVDGVVVTYLPEGLVRDPADGFDYGGPSFAERQGEGWTDRLMYGMGGGLSEVQWTAQTARWHPDSGEYYGWHQYLRGLRVTVFRGEGVENLPVLAESIWGNRTAEPEERDGRLVFRSHSGFRGEWVDVMWPVADDVALRVRVSDDLADELERIIDGLELTGPGEDFLIDPTQQGPPGDGGFCTPAANLPLTSAGQVLGEQWDRFGGVTVGHLPDGLVGGFHHAIPVSGLNDYSGPTVDHGAPDHWQYHYSYRFPDVDGEALGVTVVCGAEFPLDATQLQTFVGNRWGWSMEPQPYQLTSGRPAYIVDRQEALLGPLVAWLERPGVVLAVSVFEEELAGQLDEIVNSIQLREPGEAVAEAAAAACPLPELQPGMLPWLAEGEPVPDPVEVRAGTADEPTATMAWASDPDAEELWNVAHLQIGRIHTPENEPGERGFELVEVRGNEAELVWVGDPGMGQLRLDWREEPGPCGVYSVWMDTGNATWLDAPVVDGQPCEEYSEECAAEFQRLLEAAIVEVANALE